MNARTCQLCGKPLSRLRVGSDGDFCSKEHRNQFRLRRGMDRLVEVNKVASLMRRRENPRQIAYTRLMCQSAITPRGFYKPENTPIQAEPFNRPARYQALGAPRIAAHSERFFETPPPRLPAMPPIRRPDSGAIRIQQREHAPLLRPRQHRLPTHVAQAPARAFYLRNAARTVQREFSLLRQKGIRVHFGNGPAALRRVKFSGIEALRQGMRAPKTSLMAVEGNALRVSIGRGFAIPPTRLRRFESRPAMSSAMQTPDRALTTPPPMLDCDADSRILPASTTAIPLRLPHAPVEWYTARFSYPGAVPPRTSAANAGPAAHSRDSGIDWIPSGARWNPTGIRPPAAGFGSRNGIHLIGLLVTPTGVTSAPQVSFAPFIPQEPVGCPVVQFQGTIAGASPTVVPVTELPPEPPQPKPAPAAVVQYEEHFDAGWDNWVGGVQDWRVDVAGVRTGSMALFIPTLDLTDYDLEFFARIDSHSLNWVVRATGLEEHFRCTLTALPENQLEFSRTLVKGGQAEQHVVASLRVPGKPRSAMTVRTSVSGNSFSVAVDGKAVDSWTEDRLPSGGIGFTGAPDDRARLYWVRVSSSQSTGKE